MTPPGEPALAALRLVPLAGLEASPVCAQQILNAELVL